MGSVGNSSTILTSKDQLTDMLLDMSDEDFAKQHVGISGRRYFGQDFGRDLNRFLNDDEAVKYIYERPDFEGAVEDLDKAMVPLSRPIVVERYVDERNLPGLDINNPEKLVGKTIHTNGYLSSTVDAVNSDFEFSNYPAKVILKAPSGSPAILDANPREAEVTFGRNSDYIITSYKMGRNLVGDPQIIYYAKLKKNRRKK